MPRTPGSTRLVLCGLAFCAAVLILALLAPRLFVSRAQAVGSQTSSESVAPGVWNGLSDLAFVSPTEGWAVGYGEPCATPLPLSCTPLLRHYLHGVWSAAPLAFPGWLNTISMLSARDGWAGGYNGLLLHYDGHIWQQVANSPKLSLMRLQMFSDTDGWAIAGSDQSGTAIWRYDGGTWTPEGPRTLAFLGASYDVSMQALAMISPTEGWAAGLLIGASAPASHSGGGSVLLHYSTRRWILATRIPDGLVSAISMTSAVEGWAMGNTEGTRPATPTPAVQEAPLLLHYSQGRWKEIANPVPNPTVCCLDTVTMRSASDGWAAGPESGVEPRPIATMMHYTGGRWAAARMPLLSQAKATIARIVMTSATEGWAVGSLTRWGTPDNTALLILHYQRGAWSLSVKESMV